MEVFSVFATLSLADMISGPLGKIKASMKSVEGATAKLGDRMGSLAMSMAPVAIAAGAVLAAFGSCVGVAASFEDQMAKVGAVSRATPEELRQLEAAARELGATTQFTAKQVGEAEQYLAMAGFTAKDNIAALPGVLNLAAATATDLGRAADISSDILGAFGMKASEMGRVADALSLTCATANTNMELLGDTMKYVAPVARMAGMSLEETAAMAGMLGNVGIKGSQAGTTLKAMLNKMAAPTKEAQEALAKLGVTTKDAAGNLRSPVKVLGEMAAGLKNMGTAEQIAAMKAVVGEEAIAGFAELIKQGGIGELEKYIKVLDGAGGSAEEMAKRMNDTFAGSVRNMGSAFESVQITVGKLFLPALRKLVNGLTAVFRLFDAFAKTKVGAAMLKLAAALATVVVAVTAFSAGMWAMSKAAPFVLKALLPIKAAILGLGWPVWALIAAVAALYAAYQSNLGGIGTVVNRWARNIGLVVRGVMAVFESLKGSTFEIRGELARDIQAAGLERFVVTVAKAVFRIKEFFTGLWDGLDFSGAINAIMPAVQILRGLFDTLGEAVASVFGVEIRSAAGDARSLGETLGGALSWGMEAVATCATNLARGLDTLVSLFRMVAAVLTGDWAGAAAQAQHIWDNLCASFMSFANLFRIGDWIRNAWTQATEFLSGINLFESGQRLLDTFKEGIMAKVAEVKAMFSDALASLRNLLPFSDAKEGPLSTLTLSGTRLMSTLGEGMVQAAPALYKTLSGALDGIKGGISNWWNGLWGKPEMPAPDGGAAQGPNIPEAPGAGADASEEQARSFRQDGHQAAAPAAWTLHIANITLPNVKNAQDFYNDLQAAATEYGEGTA